MSDVPTWLAEFAGLGEHELKVMLRGAPAPIRRRLFEEWAWQAHGGQREPEGPWRVWMMMAGRGFGKTRAGAEWVSARARETPGARIALVGANLDDVAKVMIEGESGLKAVARSGEAVRWMPSKSEVRFSSGATGFAFSGERPDKLRGPQHHYAWCDELGKWRRGTECWDNLMLGLRLGEFPRTVVTTTPQPGPLLARIMAQEGMALSGGRSGENVHLPAEFLAAVKALYEGTRLGRQELGGEYLEEAEGALWTRAMIEENRVILPGTGRGTAARSGVVEGGERSEHGGVGPLRQHFVLPPPRSGEDFLVRVVIGVDPPAGIGGDACGIVVAGLGQDGLGYVLADCSVHGRSPEGWAAAVARAAEQWRADRVVAESNQGGAMVESVLRAVERDLPITLRHAHDAKDKRAEPVAALFEKGRAKFAGSFPALEDELVGLTPGGGYHGPGNSPDRADAMVWALAELMLGRKGKPQVRGL